MKKITVEFSTIDELLHQYGQSYPLKDWELVSIGQKQEAQYGLVLHADQDHHDGTVAPRVFRLDRHHLVEMAKTILQQIDPSPEHEILETLKRIEARLQETSLR